jgi:hypothetical protein
MDRQLFRRFVALLLVLAFGAGAALHGVQAAGMAAKMAATAMSDDAAPGGCGNCGGDDDGMAPTACNPMCMGFAAVMPESVSLAAPTAVAATTVVAAAGVARVGPPEPYPPRTALPV